MAETISKLTVLAALRLLDVAPVAASGMAVTLPDGETVSAETITAAQRLRLRKAIDNG